jgi:hypothetical protein
MYTFVFEICIKIFACLSIIYISHSLWIYIKDTYSTKKTKDLVNIQVSKYKQIINDLQENKSRQIIDKNEIESMDEVLTIFMENDLDIL